MRSVPHRVVCLLGLDDGVFPRAGERDGDDLILADPCAGDRDARSEDRQLLLDALLAATDNLVVTYTGRDERTNLERPPSVPVGELLDLIDRTAHPSGAATARARDRVVVNHPLQPFDARNFRAGALVPGRAWSFDAINLEGAVVRDRPKAAAGPFLSSALPERHDMAVELALVERFVRHPAKAFLRERFGIFLDGRSDEIDDALPVELDALAQWGIGDGLLAARLAGADPDACVAAEQARGLLPPGGLGGPVLRQVARTVEEIVAVAVTAGGTHTADSLDVHIELGGAVLTGVVPGVMGDVIRTTTYSKLGASHRLIAWVRLLALSAAHPDRPFEAVTIGRAVKGAGCDVALIRSLAPDAAGRHAIATAELTHLLDLLRRGLREPLPLASKTSAAWVAGGRDPAKAARQQWEGEWNRPGECADAEHRLVFGGVIDFDDLLAAAPRADEAGEGWADNEPSRFGRCAHALWDGLLARENVAKA
jgi:exodeoxyribonuclease V gamma subunit